MNVFLVNVDMNSKQEHVRHVQQEVSHLNKEDVYLVLRTRFPLQQLVLVLTVEKVMLLMQEIKTVWSVLLEPMQLLLRFVFLVPMD